MLIIDSSAALALALDRPINPHLKRLLALRRDQVGDIEQAARFLVIGPPDSMDDILQAVGFPLIIDDSPCWEWVERHDGGWTEVVFIFSDEGAADVVLVPDTPGVAPELIDLLRRFAPVE